MTQQFQVMWVFARAFLARAHEDERGMATLEKIVLTAIAVAMAIAAGAIIYNLAVDEANGIDPTFTP